MGFLFFEVGLAQKKNVTSVLFKSMLDGCNKTNFFFN